MSQQNGQSLIDPLVHEFHEQQILLVDKLYSRAYDHFQIATVLCAIYSFLKVCVPPFFIVLSQPPKQLQSIWLGILIPISLFHTIYYWRVRKYGKNKQVYLRVAEKTRHAAYFMQNQVSNAVRRTHIHENIINFKNPAATEVQEKELKVLALQIKYEVLKEDLAIKIVGRALFVLYLGIHIWGFIIQSYSEQPSPADYLIIAILFLSTYQHLQMYIGIAGLIIVLPFLLIYLGVKEIKKRRKNNQIAREIRGQKFNPMTLKGEHSCHICMDQYRQSDSITKLACNQMHHFHQKCLTEWAKVSGTCPLCRLQIQGN